MQHSGGSFGETIIPFRVSVVAVAVAVAVVSVLFEISSSESELCGTDASLEDVSASAK